MEKHYEPVESGTYRTGSTNPPKKSGCLFAFILIFLIFSIGIVSGLGLINIRLWRNIDVSEPNETVSIVVSDPEEESADAQTAKISSNGPLGIQVESVSLLYQMYYDLPSGLFITHIEPGSGPDAADIEIGDILLQVDQTAVTTQEELAAVLSTHSPGDMVTLLIHRDGEQFTAAVPILETHG